jgi:DNA gyrase/topoisomerase IV subunit A
VVESTADIQIIENMNDYRGRYFVLGHLLSPIDGYGPEQIRSEQLLARIAALRPEELVLALKPSPEGEATIHYLSELLKDKGVQVTRLSTGIPFGGVVGALTVNDPDEIMLITAKGQMVRIPVNGIRECGRNTQGVKLVTLDDGDQLKAIAPVISSEDDAEEQETF